MVNLPIRGWNQYLLPYFRFASRMTFSAASLNLTSWTITPVFCRTIITPLFCANASALLVDSPISVASVIKGAIPSGMASLFCMAANASSSDFTRFTNSSCCDRLT
ncbi:Uncharacterised protein [Raoultella ornithinolytica]|nr:Uncharacterised protein [Raoultella ornithinolytica]VUD30386.1 Uncharacterised protein [Raoultella sp. NCTC 9187]